MRRIRTPQTIESRTESSAKHAATRRPHRWPRRGSVWTVAAVVAASLAPIALPSAPAAAAEPVEITGTLPDGTNYIILVPANWNGVVINDLDAASMVNTPAIQVPLSHGYAMTGTARNANRNSFVEHDGMYFTQLDSRGEIEKQVMVLDIFAERIGEPDRVIQYGQSGGGVVALGMSELYADRVDGVISTCAHSAVGIAQMYLDFIYTLRETLDPDSTLPLNYVAPAQAAQVLAAWRALVVEAQTTPEGRARIALAVTLSQFHTWTVPTSPRPDPENLVEVQQAMFETALSMLSGFPIAAWNTGVDYERKFAHSNREQKEAVRALYDIAGLELPSDLEAINDGPRMAAPEAAIDFWRVPGRTIDGRPQVPVLRVHTIGDSNLGGPTTLLQGYEEQVRRNGANHLYRSAFVDKAGHCGFTTAEKMALIYTMMSRLDSGTWANSTKPAELNDLAASFELDGSRFIPFKLDEAHRPFFTDTPWGSVPKRFQLRH